MRLSSFSLLLVSAGIALGAAACSSDSNSDPPAGKTDAQFKTDLVNDMQAQMLVQLKILADASKDIQAAAPENKAGWNDASVKAMKDAWVRARSAYELVEGAVAPLFPDIDSAIDERYDGFFHDNGKDDYLFDDVNVTGLHAVERIIYSKEAPPNIVKSESDALGDAFKAPAYPADDKEAADFKTKLCAKLVADTAKLRDDWTPQKIDLPTTFGGLVALMNEQKEKVANAASLAEESRYSQRTMADLRDNLEGTKKAYGLFKPWLLTKSNADKEKDGKALDEAVTAGFAKLDALYAAIKTPDGKPSVALPPMPKDFKATEPTTDSDFGKLFVGVREAVDANKEDSVVHSMNHIAETLGIAGK